MMHNTHPCQPRRLSSGFSLLEAMIAVSIASLILVMAATVIRSAMQTLRQMESISKENDLLLRGWLVAMRDVDYWNSHANPNFPYLAGPLSEDVSLELNEAGDATYDHPWNKRPFRRVTFDELTNPFGERMLAHRPESWYWGNTVTSMQPVSRLAPDFVTSWALLATEDPMSGFHPSWTNAGDNVRPTMSYFPGGWHPWHITGDYASIARALAMGPDSTEYNDASPTVMDYSASLQWYLFSELGHAGAASLMPPGTMNLLTRPPNNRSRDNIGNPDKFFDWGEIPWSLARGSRFTADDFSAEAFEVPAATDAFTAGAGIDRLSARNMLLGLPGSNRQMHYVRSDRINRNFRGEWASRYYNNRGSAATFYAADLETIASRGMPDACFTYNSGDYVPHGFILPTRAFLIGSEWDTDPLIDRPIIDPFRLIFDDDATSSGYGRSYQGMHAQRMENRLRMRTQHHPAAATNDDRAIMAFGEGMKMHHEILRYRSDYRDMVRVRVVVNNPETGATIRLNTQALGTNYLGARLHWGARSEEADWARHAMGDAFTAAAP